MKSNHLTCVKQTVIFILGVIAGIILTKYDSNANNIFITIITGVVFYFTQKVSFTAPFKNNS
jgi:hypothetical protein